MFSDSMFPGEGGKATQGRELFVVVYRSCSVHVIIILVGWLAGWLVGRLAGWLVCLLCLVVRPPDLLVFKKPR